MNKLWMPSMRENCCDEDVHSSLLILPKGSLFLISILMSWQFCWVGRKRAVFLLVFENLVLWQS